MNYTILYPADFFDMKVVDADYECEYREAIKFPEFNIVLFNYDEFSAGDVLKLYPGAFAEGLCVYRGWMLQPDRYRTLYRLLLERGLRLINTPEEYEHCHEFPNAYPLIQDFTPGIKVYQAGEAIDWDEVKRDFKRFMMKDYVKSVKGTNFPVYFDCTYTDESLNYYVERFMEMRGGLFVGGIVLKEYVDLRKRDNVTNEYRAFYLNGRLLSMSKNSNQKTGNIVPSELVERLPRLNSNFYTVDFAELEDGSWTVIETGDGQVSGLSPGQYVFKYYEELLNMLQR